MSGAFKVDISRGQRIGRISSEWFSRPDDERYLARRTPRCGPHPRRERHRPHRRTKVLRVEASRDDAERLALIVPGRDVPVAPTNWSFGQLCSLVGAPASYLRQLPASLAGINMQHGLLSHRTELVKTLEAESARRQEGRGPGDVPAEARIQQGETDRIIATVLDEEGHPPASIYDFVQGITALARTRPHQDARLELEARASKLFASVH